MIKKIVPGVLLLSAVVPLRAELFVWKGAEGSPAPFSQVGNWSLEDGTAASRVPGEKDRFADKQNLSLDLEGATRRVDGWRTMQGWTRWTLALTNGTLEFAGVSTHHGGKTIIEKGGTLIYGEKAKLQTGIADAGPRQFIVRDGGVFRMMPGSDHEIYNFGVLNEKGAVTELAGAVRVTDGGQNSKIENHGILKLPNGFALGEGRGRNARVTFIQKEGLFEVAGLISTNKSPSKLQLTLDGGTIRTATNAVFELSAFTIARKASLTFDVAKGANLAFPTAKGGEQAVVRKTGAGTLSWGVNIPGGLEIAEGALRLHVPGKLTGFEKVRFASGTTLVLAAPGLEAEKIPSGDFAVRIEPDGFCNGDVLFACPDEAFLTRVFRAAPKDFGHGLVVKKEPGRLTVSSRYEIASRGDWSRARSWKNGKLPPADADVTISGKGTVVRLAAKKMPQCRNIRVTDGATLEVLSSGVLPLVRLEGDSKLIVGDGKVCITVDCANGLDFAGTDGKKPGVHIRTNAHVIANEGFSFDAADFRKDGALWVRPNAELTIWTDSMNRCYYVDASRVVKDAVSYRFIVPNFWDTPSLMQKKRRTEMRTAPFYRGRLSKTENGDFPVRVIMTTTNNVVYVKEGVVRPHKELLPTPGRNNEILVGQTVYRAYPRFTEEIIRDELCNLLVMWKTDLPLKLDGIDPKLAEKAKRDGMRFMTIYGNTPRHNVEAIKAVHGERYLMNNVGEYCSYLYQGESSAKGIPQNMDLTAAKNHFIDVKLQRGLRHYRSRYDYLLSTSGSPLANYELQGGIEYICNELYAMGSMNLAYASSEARGAARRWGPEYWCSWLAQEWQTFVLDYDSEQNYDSLLAGLYQQYVMGTSLMVLESGAQSTQAHVYKNHAKGGEKGFRQWYDDWAPTRYRETMKHFYDYVRKHPRAEGTPETNIGFILGEGGAYVGMTHPVFAMWGQHGQAKTNKNWRCGPPEWTWNKLQTIFYPLGSDNLKPYPNRWLAGSPFGQTDVVCVDEDAFYSDIARYKLLAFAGWNTMTLTARKTLDYYVSQGGVLVELLPHSSTRTDREHTNYTWDDLDESMRALVKKTPVKVSGLIEPTPAAKAVFVDPQALLKDVDEVKDMILAELAPNASTGWTVLATVGGKPLLVTRTEGKGRRYLFLGWHYPAHHGAYPAFWGNVLAALARQVKQSVTIEPLPDGTDDTASISYAVYTDAVYFANMDCVRPRRFVAVSGRTRVTFEIPPCSLLTTTRGLKKVSLSADLPPSKAKRFVPPTKEQAEEWEKTRAHTR